MSEDIREKVKRLAEIEKSFVHDRPDPKTTNPINKIQKSIQRMKEKTENY